MNLIDYNNKFEKVEMSIQEITERNAKQDNKYHVGKHFSLNHSQIEQDGGKDYSTYNGKYECTDISIAWGYENDEYMFCLKLDNENSTYFLERHLLVKEVMK